MNYKIRELKQNEVKLLEIFYMRLFLFLREYKHRLKIL